MRIIITILTLFMLTQTVLAKVQIVTTLPVFATIAQEVGGKRVRVSALSSGQKDPHHLSARPSFVHRLTKADVFIEAGLDLEKAWTQPLLTSAGNPKILPKGSGYVRAYQGIRIMEIPGADADRSWGDIHILGNPHYWLDPVNGIIIARNIMTTLIKVDPGNTAYYRANYTRLKRVIKSFAVRYLRKFKPYFGKKILVHHREWVYLARRFRLRELASLEEKPGIAPSMGYMQKLILRAKKLKPKVILVASYNPLKYARYVSKKAKIPYLVLETDVRDLGGVQTYIAMLRRVLDSILKEISR